jgi:N-acetylglucosamine PTS system EIICBA or EIICB component
MKGFFAALQQLGRAMMLPISVLPVAALLLRLGQPDLLDIAAVASAGNAIFANLGILFAIGIAVGLARENHGAAGLAAVVAYLVATKGAEILIEVPDTVTAKYTGDAIALATQSHRLFEIAKLSVPAGILSGVLAGVLYNRYSEVRLPAYLAFFSGRRFVPILCGVVGVFLALAFGYGFPVLEQGMDWLSRAVVDSGEVGLFVYGVLNRVLIVTGLHHIANNFAWFILGEYDGATGDLKRFFAGDPTAGAFMSGFFPVMMFGLPAACLAMYRAALPARRKAVGGLLLSMALTSFLTGVTEPIEFAFMFLAPVLYALHAVMTGLAMVIMDLLNVHLGFGFSAGLFDYVLNYKLSTNPLLLIPVGLAYFALYYGVFRWAITRFNLSTPGREPEEQAEVEADAGAQSDTGGNWIVALGGARNLQQIDACTTRLRLTVADNAAVNEGAMRKLGARGFVRPSAGTLQVVVGPIADQLAGDIRAALRTTATAAPVAVEPDMDASQLAAQLATRFGGRRNILDISAWSTRLVVTLRDPNAADRGGLEASARGGVQVEDATWHIIIGARAPATAAALRALPA